MGDADKAGTAAVETQRQSAELAAVERMLELSQGTFSLSIAVCNSPALRDFLIGRICETRTGSEVVSIPAGTVDVYGYTVDQLGKRTPAALFLVDMEHSIRSEDRYQHALKSLNASRDLWSRRYQCPLVLWLPEYAVALLATSARDFWSVCSHRFEFVPDTTHLERILTDTSPTPEPVSPAGNLTLEEKQFRIAELEQRLAEIGSDPSPQLVPHVSQWLDELGLIYFWLGQLDRAEETQRKAVAINEKRGRREGMASAYNTLGLIYRTRGELDTAVEMHRRALSIDETLGRREHMAVNYTNLGLIHRLRGDIDAAENMYRKALEINQELDLLEGVAVQYANLAVIYGIRGDLDSAEEMLEKSLEINEKLGHNEGLAMQYGNLGMVFRQRGDLDQAERMTAKALEISKKLGWSGGIAINSARLGRIYGKRGDTVKAREYLKLARDLFEKIGMSVELGQAEQWIAELPEG